MHQLKSLFRSSLILLTTSLILVSCGGKKDLTSEEAGKNIIAAYNPDIILSIAIGDLIEKSGIKGGDVIPWAFRQLLADYLDYLTNEEKFGISYKGRTYMMIKISQGKLENIFLVFNLSDPELFESQMKVEAETEILEKSGFKYFINDDRTSSVAWYKTFGVLSAIEREGASKEKIEAVTEDVMKKAIEKNDPAAEYNKLFAETGDFAAFYRLNALLSSNEELIDEKGKKAMENLKEFYKDSYTIYSLNFDTDRITGKVINNLNEKTAKSVKEILSTGISQDFMKYLGDEKLIGFMTGTLNPQPTLDFFKEITGDEYQKGIEKVQGETGIKIDEWIGGFTGEFAVGFAGIKKVQKSFTYEDENGKEVEETYDSTIPIVNFTVGLKGELLPKIFDTLSTIKKEKGYYSTDESFFVISNNKLFLSSDVEQVKYVAANGSFPEFVPRNNSIKATDHPYFGYFDFKKLLSIFPKEDAGGAYQAGAIKLIDKLDYAIASGNAEEATFDLYLEKTGKNSLFIITKAYFDMFMDAGFGKLGL